MQAGIMESWNHGSREVWKYGSMEVWNYGSIEVKKYGSIEVWKLESLNQGSREVWRHGNIQCVPQKRTICFQMAVTPFRILEITKVGRVLERAGADLSNAYNKLSVTQI